MLDSIYHMTLKLLGNHKWRENAKILSFSASLLWTSFYHIIKICNSLVAYPF